MGSRVAREVQAPEDPEYVTPKEACGSQPGTSGWCVIPKGISLTNLYESDIDGGRAGYGKAARPSAAQQSTRRSVASEALSLWDAVKRGTLPDGTTYYVMRHPQPKQRAELWLAVNAGSVQEDPDQQGLAHLLEHMAFNGTKRFPQAKIIDYIEKIGMGFGADLNAETGFDETVYKLTVPTDDPKYIDTGLDILRDWSRDITFDPDQLNQERGVVREEMRLGSGAQRRLLEKQNHVLLAGTRYPDRLPIGKENTILEAPRDAIVRFYRDWYRPDNMAVIVVGDVDPEKIEAQLRQKFAKTRESSQHRAPAAQRARPSGGVPQRRGTRVSIESDPELTKQIVRIYNVFPHRSKATADDLRRLVVEGLYQFMLNERFATLSRRSDSPVVTASASIGTLTRDVDMFVRGAEVKGGRIDDALRTTLTEIARVEHHGFTHGELERALSAVRRSVEQDAIGEPAKQAKKYADEIARNFFEQEGLLGARALAKMVTELLPTITLAEIQALTKTMGGVDNRVVAIEGPDRKKLPDRQRVHKVLDEVAHAQIAPWQDAPVADKLMARPSRRGAVIRETAIDAVGVTEWKLSNGVRVIVKPTNFEPGMVTIAGRSPGGTAQASLAEFPHARLAEFVVAAGGVGKHDADTLHKVLADKQVRVTAGVSETREAIDGLGEVRDLESLLQLVYLRMTAPRRDDSAIAVWKQNLAGKLAERLRDPEKRFARESNKVLFTDHPRMLSPTPEQVAAIDPARALGFYKSRFGDATDFTFVIVGDVELATLKPLVSTYLAGLPAQGRKEVEMDAGVRRAKGVVTQDWGFYTEPKAQVKLSFHGDIAWTRENARDMYILGQVLSMRLREVLREDLGGVYGVNADGFVQREAHSERVFTISFGCAPDRVDELLAATRREIEVLQKAGPNPAHLEKIKAQFLREREVDLRTNSFWVERLDDYARFGDDPTVGLDGSGLVARISSNLVQAAAKKYLDPSQVYQAVLHDNH